MVWAIDPNKVHEYIPAEEAEKPEQERTVLLGRPLTPMQYAQLFQDHMGEDGQSLSPVGFMLAAEWGLAGWRNLRNRETKQEVAFPNDGSGIRYVRPSIATSFGIFIVSLCALGEAELGESTSGSTSG